MAKEKLTKVEITQVRSTISQTSRHGIFTCLTISAAY